MLQKVIEGTVSHFDPEKGRIIILQIKRQREELSRLEMPLRMDPNVLVSTVDRGMLMLTDLKIGKKVKVRYVSRSGDRWIAKTINVLKD